MLQSKKTMSEIIFLKYRILNMPPNVEKPRALRELQSLRGPEPSYFCNITEFNVKNRNIFSL